jgi:hypothetical protein
MRKKSVTRNALLTGTGVTYMTMLVASHLFNGGFLILLGGFWVFLITFSNLPELMKSRRQAKIRARAAVTLFQMEALLKAEDKDFRAWDARHAADKRLYDGHCCNGKYYAHYTFCPVHGNYAVTPLQKEEPLPLCTVSPGMTAAQFRERMLTFQEAMKPPEPEYVPEGQAELSADLQAYMGDQVLAAASRWNAFHDPLPEYRWEMNTEWAAEVKKLKVQPGYPVKVSDEYGMPELVAS